MAGFRFEGGVAVVTGAAGGIGLELARGLARRGCNLALCDINAEALERVATELEGHGLDISTHVVDVADPAAAAPLRDAIVATHGRVTLLFNNAGVALGGFFPQIPEEKFDWLMQVNFHGPVRLVRLFLPLMQDAQEARIINVSSIFGLIAPPEQTAYCASKFALRGFSESLRHELDGSNVGVSVVHPGGVKTNIARNAVLSGDDGAMRKRMSEFERNLKLPADKAAAIILRGVEARKPRILVGADAKLICVVQRLMPAGYFRAVGRLLKGVERPAART